MAEENFGVVDASKTYNQHALARIFGVTDTRGECSKFILRNLLHAGLPFMKIGRHYFINGHVFNLWIQEGSAPWEAWKEPSATKSSDDAVEAALSAAGTTTISKSGGKRHST